MSGLMSTATVYYKLTINKVIVINLLYILYYPDKVMFTSSVQNV